MYIVLHITGSLDLKKFKIQYNYNSLKTRHFAQLKIFL